MPGMPQAEPSPFWKDQLAVSRPEAEGPPLNSSLQRRPGLVGAGGGLGVMVGGGGEEFLGGGGNAREGGGGCLAAGGGGLLRGGGGGGLFTGAGGGGLLGGGGLQTKSHSKNAKQHSGKTASRPNTCEVMQKAQCSSATIIPFSLEAKLCFEMLDEWCCC